jgi:hypothetical protein
VSAAAFLIALTHQYYKDRTRSYYELLAKPPLMFFDSKAVFKEDPDSDFTNTPGSTMKVMPRGEVVPSPLFADTRFHESYYRCHFRGGS